MPPTVGVPLGADALVVLLLGSSVAPLGVSAVPGVGVAELLMWLGVAEVGAAGGSVSKVPERLEVLVLLLVGELSLPMSAWTTAGVATVSAIPWRTRAVVNAVSCFGEIVYAAAEMQSRPTVAEPRCAVLIWVFSSHVPDCRGFDVTR